MSKQKNISIFQVSDFREFIRFWTSLKGRGEFTRISKFLHVQTTLVSQIMSGQKCFTEEQAFRLTRYMELTAKETDFFIKLIQKERAGTIELKSFYDDQLKLMKSDSNLIKNRIKTELSLSQSDMALFYSSWKYAAVRLLTDIDNYRTPESISKYLNISIFEVKQILDFLESKELCTVKDLIYKRTSVNTYVDSSSPLATRHHQNWRNKAIALQEKMSLDDISFTAPLTISKEDRLKVREILLEAIASISNVVKKSESQELHYLGIDWLKI